MEKYLQEQKLKIENFLQSYEEHKNKKIDYILYNPITKETDVIASEGEEVINFTPYTKDLENGYVNVADWAYNFDEYLFQNLEKGYVIGYMSDESHYGIWNSIKKLYPEDINYKDGVQWYLQYCADEGISKKYLDDKLGFDTPNIMKHFEGLALFETMEYKGYFIEADGTNLDNAKENLVNIYENREDYNKREPIETISLNTVGLKQNIRDYIDEFYIDKNVVEKEQAYYTFVLGYDLLNEEFKSSPSPECDLTYGFCNKIAKKFIDSDYYKYKNCSSYEMLEKYISDNRDEIQKDYEEFIGFSEIKDKQFNNGIYVIDVGYRGNQPIALVQKMGTIAKKNYKEYIIAFNYEVKNNKLSWGYGRYYYKNLAKAKADFQYVLAGGNLAENREKFKEER